jgi:hypothetical protein
MPLSVFFPDGFLGSILLFLLGIEFEIDSYVVVVAFD